MSAPSGEQALDLLATAPAIALLFTDVVMPGVNGKQLADAAQAARPGLPVLYTTGYTRNAIIHNGMLDPGVALLQKPFTIAQLATRVRAVIDASEDDTTTRVGMAEIGAASGNATDANA